MSAAPTILVIEDNLLNLEMACELLESAGFATQRAENATQGLQIAEAAAPDLILMDLHLPGLDGFTATRLIRQHPKLSGVPVVAFTALAMPTDRERAFAAGCNGFITKPINVHRFASNVASFLAEAPQVATLAEPVSLANLQAFGSPEVVAPLLPEGLSGSARVLIVDDNALNVELLREALADITQYVLTAGDGPQALQIAQKQRPDLILLDIMMPTMDGFAVLEELRRVPETRNIPVIFISALGKPQDIVRGLAAGTFDYISKPFHVEEVQARVRNAIRIKQLQDCVRQERDRLERILTFSADAIALLDANWCILTANPRFREWFPEFDVSAEPQPLLPLIPCQCPWVRPCPHHQSNVLLCPPKEGTDESEAAPTLLTEMTLPAVNGNPDEVRHLSLRCGADREGGYVLVFRDVTQERRLERRRQMFVATLTHDLKTPIRAEFQALKLLRSGSMGPITAGQQELLSEIISSNRFMHRMVDNLLTTYKFEDGQMDLHRERVDLNELIRKALATDLSLLATEKHQRLELRLAENPSPVITGDWIELQRVLHNLVQNAITYTPEGGVITIATRELLADEVFPYPCVELVVTDTGRGIEPEQLPTLFESYASGAKKFRQVGTGLGLYLCRQIVESHGGVIRVESQLGHGSRFIVLLPLQQNP
jgi:CheY-like chemotaxis protein/signal transduction histidine kinase